MLYPTGAGERVTIGTGALASYSSVEWFPDGKRLLVCGAEAGRPPRCFEQGVEGASARPVTDEGVLATLGPDGQTVLLTLPDGTYQLSTISGGATAAGHGVQHRRPAGRVVDRLPGGVRAARSRGAGGRGARGLASGKRTRVAQLTPEGLGAVAMIYVTDWARDGEWYAYNYTSIPSTLFVVSGATP